MEYRRILELALEALQNRRMQVEAEVEVLRAEMRVSGRATLKRKPKPISKLPGKRRTKTPAERRAQSKRMKAYWAAKKAAASAKAKKPIQSGAKGRAKSAA